MVETYIIKEAAARIAIVVLGSLCVIFASVWLITLNPIKFQLSDIQLSLTSELGATDVMSVSSQRSSGGWIIFLSLVMNFYQFFSTVHLFKPIKELQNLTVRLYFWKTKWYLLQLIDLVVCTVHTIGCLCVIVPVIVYFLCTIGNIIKSSIVQSLDTDDSKTNLETIISIITDPVSIVHIITIFILAIFMDVAAGMSIYLLFYILKAKYAYKRPNHDISATETSPTAVSDASNVQTVQLGTNYQQM